jgi:hypothetical protein
MHDHRLRQHGALRALGGVRQLRMMDTTPGAEAASAGHCGALAVECAEGVVVVWSPSRMGRLGMQLNSQTRQRLCWSVMDLESWRLRLADWRNTLAAIGSVEVVSATPMQRLGDGADLHLSHFEANGHTGLLQGGDDHLQMHFGSARDGAVTWRCAAAPAPEDPALPTGLLPATRITVTHATGTFQSAEFEGWPLAWRRACAAAMGLAPDAPVNHRGLLPQGERANHLLQNWTCRALAVRLSNLPLLRQRLQHLPMPRRLGSITEPLLTHWWPLWLAGADAGATHSLLTTEHAE